MEALAPVQDVGELFPIDAQPVGGFFDGQPLTHDEADSRPVQGGFGPRVVLALHVLIASVPRKAGDTRGIMLRAPAAEINRHMY